MEKNNIALCCQNNSFEDLNQTYNPANLVQHPVHCAMETITKSLATHTEFICGGNVDKVKAEPAEWYFEWGGGWQGAIAWPPEKIKFNISEMVVYTSYFTDYSEITKHWLY